MMQDSAPGEGWAGGSVWVRGAPSDVAVGEEPPTRLIRAFRRLDAVYREVAVKRRLPLRIDAAQDRGVDGVSAAVLVRPPVRSCGGAQVRRSRLIVVVAAVAFHQCTERTLGSLLLRLPLVASTSVVGSITAGGGELLELFLLPCVQGMEVVHAEPELL